MPQARQFFLPDRPAEDSSPRRSALDGRIRLHRNLLKRVEGKPTLEKRLTVLAHQLVALGRTSVMKGCRDTENRGWFRTPLAGHGGMQYYLWWTSHGSQQCRGLAGLQRRDILLRAVRHHDNHRPLRTGPLDDYDVLGAQDLDDREAGMLGLPSPWTETQRRFTNDDDPVRVVHGYPGSGKTMALWRAVEARRGRTLYLTWSSALCDEARKRFEAFAPEGCDVTVQSFRGFVGSVCGRDIDPVPLAQSRKKFAKAYAWWKIQAQMGPWADRLAALHAELRGVLFGRAVPGLLDCSDCGSRLLDDTYRSVTEVGAEAADALLETLRKAGWETWYGSVFPELEGARDALKRLRDDGLPSSLAGFERVVVDEVQDLSLLETAVVAHYCRALQGEDGHVPPLMMALDGGQTVRPSGFDRGRLGNLLFDALTNPHEHSLEASVRSPVPIARVVTRASRLYGRIDKGRRPPDQSAPRTDHQVHARLFHVEVPSAEKGKVLIRALQDASDLAVVCSRDAVPGWIPPDLGHAVQTPETAKGLEYASVCVLEAGKLLGALAKSSGSDRPIEIQEQRTAIDGLRVAVSRATENLILVDVKATAGELHHSRELLGEPETLSPDDLVEFVRDSDLPLDERVLVRTRDAMALVDKNPDRAWQRAVQALGLIGDADPGMLESFDNIRYDVWSTALTVAAHALTRSRLDRSDARDKGEVGHRAARLWSHRRVRHAFACFEKWARRQVETPFEMFSSALVLDAQDRNWLESALPSVTQSLLEDLRGFAQDRAHARRYAGDIERWLGLVGFTGDRSYEAEALRGVALRTLADAEDWSAAEHVRSRMRAPDPGTAGTVLEELGRFVEAAHAFVEAGDSERAHGNWRNAGKINRALKDARGQVHEDLQWIKHIEELVGRRPRGLRNRLKTAEKKRLQEVLKKARVPIPRKKPDGSKSGPLFDD